MSALEGMSNGQAKMTWGKMKPTCLSQQENGEHCLARSIFSVGLQEWESLR